MKVRAAVLAFLLLPATFVGAAGDSLRGALRPVPATEILCPPDGEAALDVVPYPPRAGITLELVQSSWEAIPWVLSSPSVNVGDRQIVVTQAASMPEGPAPPPSLHCVTATALLGPLAAGRYEVVWQFTGSAQVTHRYPMDVQATASVPTMARPAQVLLALALLAVGAYFTRG